MVKTRFAPSPTGYLHIGGARTALFSWAYARKAGGKFVLRIEDTDLERSTEESVQAIIEGLRWLGIHWDEGPYRQMERLARYREAAERLVREGKAYRCYCSRERLEQLRAEQRARGEKPRYDGRCRNLVEVPSGVAPVIRFRSPTEGEVSFTDLIKGPVTVSNAELDDLVLLRADGVPTYNFGVVVDDIEMGITHVIRGDDHVNNTPRQIHLFRALGGDLPQFAHVPMILGANGERLSKRHGAVSVMQYAEDGYLPEALVNYLARLGWSHGNEEIFSVAQFVEWFDLAHVARSPAQFDPTKLRWINHEYIKRCDVDRLATLVAPRIVAAGGTIEGGPPLAAAVSLLKERAETLTQLAAEAMMFYKPAAAAKEEIERQLNAKNRPALAELLSRFSATSDWNGEAVSAAVQEVIRKHALKMPDIAVPLRLIVFGRAQTPSLGAALALAGKRRVVERLKDFLDA